MRAKFPGMSKAVAERSFSKLPAVHPHPDQEKAMALNRKLEIRPTTDVAKLNKLETEYLAWLQNQRPMWFGVQCLTLKIGHDCRYTPDFFVLDETGLRAVDTKHMRNGKVHIEDDALVKMKCTARLFPWIHIVVAWRENGVWQHRAINV